MFKIFFLSFFFFFLTKESREIRAVTGEVGQKNDFFLNYRMGLTIAIFSIRKD